MAFHRALQKFERSLAITAFRRENLKHLTLMIHGPPEVVGRAIDPHKHLVQMPAPLRIGPMMKTVLSYLRGEHWTEPVPPEPQCLLADVDTTL